MVKFMRGNVPSVVQGRGLKSVLILNVYGTGALSKYTGVNVSSVNLLSLYLNDSLSIAINLCNP